MCLQILRVSLLVLAGWALSTASSEPGWTHKRSLAQRGHLNEMLSEGERCWLGTRIRRPKASPQHHLFGVYPSRPGSSLRPYPMGDQGTHHAGRSKPAAEGMAVNSIPPDWTAHAAVRTGAEQLAALWVGDGPIGQWELLGDDDTYLDDRGSKAPLGEAGTWEGSATAATIITTFARQKEPRPETRRKGLAKLRRRRQVVKGLVEGMRGDPDVTPQHFGPWPKRPLMHGVRTSSSEDSVQNGRGNPYWEAETSNPHGGGLPILYFSGRRERLLLRPEVLAEVPREAFTVEAWVKPEGGQSSPTIIAGNGLSWDPWAPWGAAGLMLDGVRPKGAEGKGTEQESQEGPARKRGVEPFFPSTAGLQTSSVVMALTTRASVPGIDLRVYTWCWHLGDLWPPLLLLKGDDLWFFVPGDKVSPSTSHSPVRDTQATLKPHEDSGPWAVSYGQGAR